MRWSACRRQVFRASSAKAVGASDEPRAGKLIKLLFGVSTYLPFVKIVQKVLLLHPEMGKIFGKPDMKVTFCDFPLALRVTPFPNSYLKPYFPARTDALYHTLSRRATGARVQFRMRERRVLYATRPRQASWVRGLRPNCGPVATPLRRHQASWHPTSPGRRPPTSRRAAAG